MNTKQGESRYEVLNPWADADPVRLRGITPRLRVLKDQTIGLFIFETKVVSRPTILAVEKKLKERFPFLKFSTFSSNHDLNRDVTESSDRERFVEWVKGVDAAIAAFGD